MTGNILWCWLGLACLVILLTSGFVSASGIPLVPGYNGTDYVFSGDYSGGKITITSPGAYYLTDNLTGSSTDYVLQVNASDVILAGNAMSVTGTGDTGIHVTPEANNVTVANFSSVSGFTTGLYLQGRGEAVSENTVRDNEQGIVIEGNDTRVSGNNASYNAGPGIVVPANNGTVVGNVALGNAGSGIDITGIYNAISGNQASDNQKNGISCRNLVSISGNTVTGNRKGGIVAWDGAEIWDNIVSGNERYGIKTQNNAMFINNTVTGNRDYGITTTKNASLLGNKISQNLGHGLFTGNNASLSDNNISSNSKYGLYGGSYVTLSDCIFNNNGLGGIVAGNDVTVSQSVVSENEGSGIEVSNHARVINNTVENNLGSGIFTLHGAEIHKNTLTGNRDYGINGWGTSNITDNLITTSNQGIFLPDNSDRVVVAGNTITGSLDTGIWIDGGGWSAGSGSIYDNNLSNAVNAGGTGILSYFLWTNPAGPQPGTNCIGGPSIAGNYWSNATGTGWSDLQDPAPYGYSLIPYEIVNGSGVYDTAPLVRFFYTVSSSSDAWTVSYPHGNRSYPHSSDAAYLTQARPGSDLVNVSVDGSFQGPVGNWTFTSITANHTISSTGQPTPGQVHALFSMNTTRGAAPLTVQFTNQSLGDPTSFYWGFGDGKNATVRDPVHRYDLPGTYSVTLKALNEKTGGIAVLHDAITVTDGVVPVPTPAPAPGVISAAFSADRTTGPAPLQVSFTDNSTGNPVSWSWDLGDGNTSTRRNVTHTYISKGNYSVSLSAGNSISTGSLEKSGYISVN